MTANNDCLSRSLEALAFAQEHLKSARILSAAELTPQAFGLLVYGAEECVKARILFLVHLDLVTFDRELAGSKRFFSESWLGSHTIKHEQFGAASSAQVASAGVFLMLMGGASDRDAALGLLVAFGLAGLSAHAWCERLEDLRQMAFHSGPPSSGNPEVSRPRSEDYSRLESFVSSELDRLRKLTAPPWDVAKIDAGLPSRATWNARVGPQSVGSITEALEAILADPPMGWLSEPPPGGDPTMPGGS